MSDAPHQFRNPGPTWSYAFLWRAQQLRPRWVRDALLVVGTWVAVAQLPVQRRHSLDFLSAVLGRPAGLRDVWRHFYTYLKFLLLRLRIAKGAPARCVLDPLYAADFEDLMQSGEPALFGTFHFGHSDLLGFLLALRGRRVAMVRLRVGNSGDTVMLKEHFGDAVSFIWVNDPDNLLFTMKDALERGDSLAMQCDRLFSSRTQPFEFLGATRVFPFAIYHLAILFDRPVMFCIGVPEGADGTRVRASPLFRPDATLGRAENIERARLHFQSVLQRLEALVHQHPYDWFNFLPLNPVVAAPPPPIPATAAERRGPN